MILKAQGIMDFTPQDVTRKHKNQSSWKCVAMIKTNCDVSAYYAWFLKNRFNLKLNPPLRGSHISFISDRMDKNTFMEASKIFNGKEITFYYDPWVIRSNDTHWWINIQCPEAEAIRESLGLSKIPYFGFHLTLGIANEKNAEHSKYIKDCCMKFNLL